MEKEETQVLFPIRSARWKVQTRASLIWGVILLLVLNFADWLSTVLLRTCALEGNPLMVAIINQPPPVSLAFKMTITLSACLLLTHAYNKGPRKYAKSGFAILNIFYGMVVANNILLFTRAI